jgi:N-acetylglucosamine-6-phosphate deacetylase
LSAIAIELPGLFELQVNGFGGVDFNGADLTAERAAEGLQRIRATGVTRCLPTLITSSFERFAASARVLSRMRAPMIAGIHMEGPYISPFEGARGAHPIEHVISASIEDFKRRQDAADGRIVLVTLAPEVDGAAALIEHLVADGVRVAIGHTLASPREIGDAIAAGATLATHLGNGCPSMLPRHPNAIWELLAADAIFASFIVDGHHLPPSTVKAMIRAKGPERSVLVTDAVAAAGCAPGRYTIGGVDSEVSANGRVSLPGTSYLAGSALSMPRAIGNTVKFAGLPLERVVPMATTIPAGLVGLSPVGLVSAEWDPDACELRVQAVRE